MRYWESSNSYSETQFDDMQNIRFISTPQTEWFVAEDWANVITETYLLPQVSVGTTYFLVTENN